MNSLNVKVGDIVCIAENEKVHIVDSITKVVKVLPNGRFMTEYDNQYWKADGTRNTKARKYDKHKVATLGNKGQFSQYLRGEEIPKFLKHIADEMGYKIFSTDNLIVISKFFEIFGFEQPSDVKQMITRIQEFEKGEN